MNTKRRFIVALAIVAHLGASGCSRPFYRKQADADAYCLTDQKAVPSLAPIRWNCGSTSIRIRHITTRTIPTSSQCRPTIRRRIAT